jgi:hypothetical protein
MAGVELSELEALYRQRFPHFVRVATALLRDEDRAVEAVQEAFAAAVRARRIGQLRGPKGTTTTIEMTPTHRFRRCWRLSFSTGQRSVGCMETIATGAWSAVNLVQPAGRDVFVVGTTRPPVARVQLRFADGDVISTRPLKRFFVLAIPRRHLSTRRQLAFAVGVDRDGNPVQRQGVLFRANRR